MEKNINTNIEEELFCTQYELKTLSDLLVHSNAERWVKGFLFKKYEDEHLDRYNYALSFVQGKSVLDIACGCGYGSYLLAEKGKARKVIGVDLDHKAVRYGSFRYPHQNVERFTGDACFYKAEEAFETIVSFETIEHIPKYELFLKNIHQNLTDEGILIISTPVRKTTTAYPQHNPHHIIEWSFKDFKTLVEKYFKIENVVFQNVTFKGNSPKYSVWHRALNKIGIKKFKKTPDLFLEGFTDWTAVNPDHIENGYAVACLRKKIC